MSITLDQARTLDALAREGTLQLAAKRLRKGHPAVLYALKQLEQQTGLAILDRYREVLPSGAHVAESRDWQRRLKGEMPSLLDRTKDVDKA